MFGGMGKAARRVGVDPSVLLPILRTREVADEVRVGDAGAVSAEARAGGLDAEVARRGAGLEPHRRLHARVIVLQAAEPVGDPRRLVGGGLVGPPSAIIIGLFALYAAYTSLMSCVGVCPFEYTLIPTQSTYCAPG